MIAEVGNAADVEQQVNATAAAAATAAMTPANRQTGVAANGVSAYDQRVAANMKDTDNTCVFKTSKDQFA